MKRIDGYRSVAIAIAALVSLAVAGCGTTVAGAPPKSPPKSAPQAEDGFAGYKWQVVTIRHDGKQTSIQPRYSVYLQFAPNGQFGANEPVNYHFGNYRVTADGFMTSDVGMTLAAYGGNDPVVPLAENAISAFDNGVDAKTGVSGDRLTVSVGGYTLTCQRDGAQANFPSGSASASTGTTSASH